MTITRPLLAEKIADVNLIKYPCLVSEKLDGFRILKVEGEVKTRNFKKLPNRHTRAELEKLLPDGIDGEVMLTEGNFQDIQSNFMSFEGEPSFVYYAFDYIKEDLLKPYLERIKDLKDWYDEALNSENGNLIKERVKLVLPKLINTAEELLLFEDECLNAEYEGVMIRSLTGKYKCGRSTLKEGILLKLKRFEDSEALIIGFKEGTSNTNEKVTNELGLSKRSSKKAGMILSGTLGRFVVRDIYSNVEFEIGTGEGLNDELKQEIWDNQSKYLNKIIKYNYQKTGTKIKADGKFTPRFPSYQGFRDLADLDPEVQERLGLS